MVSGEVIGEAVVSLAADTDGFLRDISDATSEAEGKFSDMSESVSKSGDGFKSVGTALTVGVSAPLALVGAAGLKASSDVGGGLRTLQRGVNDTGTSLDGLKNSFKNVFGTTPVDATELGEAMSNLHMQTGLTGTALEELTTKFINLSRVTGTPLLPNIENVTSALREFGVPVDQDSAKLDELYKVSLATNLPFDQLATTLQNNAAIFRAYGLNVEQSAAFLGELKQQGIDSTPVMSGLRKEISNGSSEYKKDVEALDNATTALSKNTDAKKTATLTTNLNNAQSAVTGDLNANLGTSFEQLVGKIRGAKSETEGMNISVDAFGTKAGPQMYTAIMTNKVGFDDFKKVTGDTTTGIDDMNTSTSTFSDSMTVMKQRTELALSPLGTAITKTMKSAEPDMLKITGLVEQMGKKFAELPEPVQRAAVLTGAFATQLGPVAIGIGNAMPAVDKFWGGLGKVKDGLVWVIGKLALSTTATTTNTVAVKANNIANDTSTGNLGKVKDALIWVATKLGISTGATVANTTATGLNTGVVETSTIATNLNAGAHQNVATKADLASGSMTAAGGAAGGAKLGYMGLIGTLGELVIVLGLAYVAQQKLNEVMAQRAQDSPKVAQETGTAPDGSKVYDAGGAGGSGGVVAGNKSDWWNVDVGGWFGRIGMASGGIVRNRPGGVPIVVGEGGEDEYIIPTSKMGDFGAIAAQPQMAGGTVFNVAFNNATLTSVDEADRLGRRMAYTANEYLRRSGHSRG